MTRCFSNDWFFGGTATHHKRVVAPCELVVGMPVSERVVRGGRRRKSGACVWWARLRVVVREGAALLGARRRDASPSWLLSRG